MVKTILRASGLTAGAAAGMKGQLLIEVGSRDCRFLPFDQTGTGVIKHLVVMVNMKLN